MLLADGFEKAFVGEAMRYGFDEQVAAYDYDACIEVLMSRDGMSHEDAVEFFDYNVIGGWVGEQTPVFVRKLPLGAVV